MSYLPQHDSDWSNVPHTDSKAQPVLWQVAPKGRYVVYVEKASIRNAVMENEWFLLAENAMPKKTDSGEDEIEVECYWYGCKPKTTWMHLATNKDFCRKEAHGERVVLNIQRRA